MNGSIFWAVLGLVAGAVISWVLSRSRQRQALAEASAAALQVSTALQIESSSFKERASRIPDLEAQLDASSRLTATLREQVSRLTAELTADRDTLGALRVDLQDTRSLLAHKIEEAASQAIELAKLRNTLDSERGNSQEKLALLLDAKVALTDQFKSLTNDILEEKSKRFTEQNQTNLGALLDPLKLKITEFQTKIEDTYVKEGNERSALGVELRHLKELNQLPAAAHR